MVQPRRYIAHPSAENDRRGGVVFQQRGEADVVAVQQLHRGRYQRDADSRPHQPDRRLQLVGPLRDVDAHAVGLEQGNHMVGVTRPWIAGVQHKGFLGQFPQTDGPCEQRMPGGQGGDQAVFGEHGLDDGRVVDTDSTETDIDAPGLQRLHLLQGGHFRKPQLQLQRLATA
ncbi:hypothetical protein D3C73_642680 [compost metagenome]